MERESGVTRSIIDECHFWITKEIKCNVKVWLLELCLKNFIIWISKEIKGKVKVVLLEESLMKFILRISKESKWKVKVVFSKYL